MNTKTRTTRILMLIFTIAAWMPHNVAMAQTGYEGLDTVYVDEDKVTDLLDLMNIESEEKPFVEKNEKGKKEDNPVKEVVLAPVSAGFLQYSYVKSMQPWEVDALIRQDDRISSIGDVLQRMIDRSAVRGEIREKAYDSNFKGHIAGEDNVEVVAASGLDLTCIRHNSGSTVYGLNQVENSPFNDETSKYRTLVNDGSGIQTYDQYCKKYSLLDDSYSETAASFIQWVTVMKELEYAPSKPQNKKLLEKINQIMPESAKLNKYYGDDLHKNRSSFDEYYSNNEMHALENAWNEYLRFSFVFGDSTIDPLTVIESFEDFKNVSSVKTSNETNVKK